MNDALKNLLCLEDDPLHVRGLCSFGGGGSTNTIQSTTPWAGQQPYLSDIYNMAAQNVTNSVPSYYPSDTYAPMTGEQNALMSNLIGADQSGGGSGIQAANQNITSMLSPAYTAQTQGTFNQGTNVLNNELSSSYLNPENSPAYQTAIGNAMAAAIPAASASFVNGNRSDSGLAQAATTSAASNAAAGLAQQQYQANQAIQNSAAQQASSNLLNQQSNQTRSDLTAPIVQQGLTSDMATALGASGMSQTDLQNQINANVSAYNYGQMLPFNMTSMFENAITGTGSPGGTSQTSQPYFTNPIANLASAGLGASALGSLGSQAAIGAGYAGGLAGLGGSSAAGTGFAASLLGSLFSDRRLKTDIQEIGETTSGFPLFLFRYKNESPMARHIGVMAQDVEKTRPWAVIETPRGKMVDYIQALAA